MPDLIQIIKKAAIEAVQAANPCSIMFGVVTKTNPLNITIESRLTLDESFLILTSAVSTFSVDVDVSVSTSNSISVPVHNHTVSGRKTITVHLGLSIGESVMLMQVQGGQKYVVLDRVGG